MKKFILILTSLLMVLTMFTSCFGGSHKSKWSTLTEQEKENAEWAYYAKQAIDSRK